VRLLAALLVLVAALAGCGSDDPEETAPPADLQRRTKPVWCPKQRYEPARRPDGRYDVERVPHGDFDARRVIGLKEGEARRLAQGAKCDVRVVERDGEELARTDDLRNDRINVAVERGYVVAIDSVG